ncbi:hypothetical protein H4R33_002271 [Dimargaris cristalligena]|nr:hypothetical protein H4R33_002271 [Dimargaris cristalligena]
MLEETVSPNSDPNGNEDKTPRTLTREHLYQLRERVRHQKLQTFMTLEAVVSEQLDVIQPSPPHPRMELRSPPQPPISRHLSPVTPAPTDGENTSPIPILYISNDYHALSSAGEQSGSSPYGSDFSGADMDSPPDDLTEVISFLPFESPAVPDSLGGSSFIAVVPRTGRPPIPPAATAAATLSVGGQPAIVKDSPITPVFQTFQPGRNPTRAAMFMTRGRLTAIAAVTPLVSKTMTHPAHSTTGFHTLNNRSDSGPDADAASDTDEDTSSPRRVQFVMPPVSQESAQLNSLDEPVAPSYGTRTSIDASGVHSMHTTTKLQLPSTINFMTTPQATNSRIPRPARLPTAPSRCFSEPSAQLPANLRDNNIGPAIPEKNKTVDLAPTHPIERPPPSHALPPLPVTTSQSKAAKTMPSRIEQRLQQRQDLNRARLEIESLQLDLLKLQAQFRERSREFQDTLEQAEHDLAEARAKNTTYLETIHDQQVRINNLIHENRLLQGQRAQSEIPHIASGPRVNHTGFGSADYISPASALHQPPIHAAHEHTSEGRPILSSTWQAPSFGMTSPFSEGRISSPASMPDHSQWEPQRQALTKALAQLQLSLDFVKEKCHANGKLEREMGDGSMVQAYPDGNVKLSLVCPPTIAIVFVNGDTSKTHRDMGWTEYMYAADQIRHTRGGKLDFEYWEYLQLGFCEKWFPDGRRERIEGLHPLDSSN